MPGWRNSRSLPSPLLLLSLLSALCWLSLHAASPEEGCFDPELDTTRHIGEQWLLPDCGGVAWCTEYSGIRRMGCPASSECRRRSEGDPTAAYPSCCPRLACDACYSERLGRHFGPGETWTEAGCVQSQCRFGPAGTPFVARKRKCELPEFPSLDCELVVPEDGGDFPECCAYYRCPGLCYSEGQWRPIGRDGRDHCTPKKGWDKAYE